MINGKTEKDLIDVCQQIVKKKCGKSYAKRVKLCEQTNEEALNGDQKNCVSDDDNCHVRRGCNTVVDNVCDNDSNNNDNNSNASEADNEPFLHNATDVYPAALGGKLHDSDIDVIDASTQAMLGKGAADKKNVKRLGNRKKNVITPSWLRIRKPLQGYSLRKSTFIPYNPNVTYEYWDDPNELCERLKMLISSQNAGNTNHIQEIDSIIEELSERGLIS